jgi:hypothetical protein
MATFSKGYTFGSTEQVTNAKLHALVDSATISGITNDDIDSAAAIATSKLAAIDGSRLSGLGSIPSGSGVIPAANLTSVAQKGANSDITSLTGLTTALATSKGGTGSTAAANAANGVVVLNASAQLPAVSGALLTNLPTTKATLGIDYGRISINTNENKTISFNFTFTSAPTVIITYEHPDGGETSQTYLFSVSTTSFVVHSPDAAGYIHWLAVGTKA